MYAQIVKILWFLDLFAEFCVPIIKNLLLVNEMFLGENVLKKKPHIFVIMPRITPYPK